MTELTFQEILVTTDLSVASRASYGHAVAFARAFDARVTLLHVDDSEEDGHDDSESAEQRSVDAKLRNEALERVEANFVDLGVPVVVERDTGNAYRQILERADSDRFDLLVMAKQGAGADAIRAMGMTAERVMHNSRVPVIVGYAPTPEFGDVAHYHRLAVSTDFSEDSRAGIRRALELAERFDAQVDILHAVTRKRPVGRKTDAEQALHESYVAAQQVHLNQQHSEELNHPRATARVHAGTRVPDALVAGALDAKSDLLCLPTHGKGAIRRAFFGSTADRVMRIATMPSLIMPRQWLEV